MLEFLNFDTIYGDYTSSNNPYDVKFILASPMRKVKYIYLKSIELPIGFNNIRTSSTGLTVFSFTLNSTTYSVTLTDKVYTNISTLLTDINTLITNLGLSTTITLAVSSTYSSRVSISLSTSSTLTILSTGLSQYVLGMAGQSVTGIILTANNNYLLNVDNYINIYLANIPAKSHNNYYGVISSYKVPLNCTSNVVYYQSEQQSFTQFVEITDQHYILSKIHIKILDRWGNVIPSQGLDYSLTFGIKYFD
jgi:hypothetical protein